MSCGLGAVILVFMLVKYNVDVAGARENQSLELELTQLAAEEAALSRQVAAARADQSTVETDVRSASAQLAQIEIQLADKRRQSARQQKDLTALKKTIEKTEIAKTSDLVDDANAGEQDYVVGLKVEGDKIIVLLDSSASMTDEVLIDVIRRKNRPDQEKQAGPKWQRSKRIVQWVLARLPHDSLFQVIAYDEKARSLGASGWLKANNPQAQNGVRAALSGLVPSGATNLQAGLKAVTRAAPTNVYLVTDGLPTKGDSNFKSLNPFASCSSLRGASNTISGACRLKLFQHSVDKDGPTRDVPVNVILLPIEGDPQASSAYWSWTSATGGLLISPAASWP